MNSLVRYFDLQSANRSTLPVGHASKRKVAAVWPQYGALVAGVIAEPLLRDYITTGSWHFSPGALLGRALFGLIIGVIILPAAYRRSFDPSKPTFVQLCAMFPLGIGWQSVFTAATKIAVGD